MTLNNVKNLKIENGICSYDEEVVNNAQLVYKLKGGLAYKTTEERNEMQKVIDHEKKNIRLIHYSFPISRIKTHCVDCGKQIAIDDDFEKLLYNNIARGNYCGNCNARYK